MQPFHSPHQLSLLLVTERSKYSVAKRGSWVAQPQDGEGCETTREGTQVPIEHRDTWAALYISFFDQCTKAGMTTETQQLGIPNRTAILRTTNFINGLGGEDGEGLEIKCVVQTKV